MLVFTRQPELAEVDEHVSSERFDVREKCVVAEILYEGIDKKP